MFKLKPENTQATTVYNPTVEALQISEGINELADSDEKIKNLILEHLNNIEKDFYDHETNTDILKNVTKNIKQAKHTINHLEPYILTLIFLAGAYYKENPPTRK
ncbi:MAG: hypothetical protein FWD52_00325 [Candidatus Bathyarchaeota archaeon]|nr:hypothetical protein [Candidatus Termiticorpusculum sp.]